MEINFLGKDLFTCIRCGLCCSNQFETRKELLIYPEEAEVLIALGFQKKILVEIKEDLVFPDTKNKVLLVARYKIKFKNNLCPFLKENLCELYDNRPIICRAFPLIVKEKSNEEFEVVLEQSCEGFKMSKKNIDEFSDQSAYKKYFPSELKYLKDVFKKEKSILMKLQEMESKGKIQLGFDMTKDEYALALKEWKRLDLFTDSDDF